MKFLPYGDTALLVDDLADRRQLLQLRSVVLAESGVIDAVPAARTLLIEFDPVQIAPAALVRLLETVPAPASTEHAAASTVDVSIRYDGADLDDVARAVGVHRDEVIERHSSPIYTVAFCGFAPGFAYLDGIDPQLQMPRLERPRTSVPAGSVGIAGEYTGIYPRSSPGGWRLLGTTDVQLWDLARQPPALLHPAATVRFIPA